MKIVLPGPNSGTIEWIFSQTQPGSGACHSHPPPDPLISAAIAWWTGVEPNVGTIRNYQLRMFATLFRGGSNEERFHPLTPAVKRMHLRVKQAFDPLALFNPGRMSRDW